MQLYNDYSSYLRRRYGCKVYRIGLDAGFSCPNRDGTKGSGGCSFCNAGGSRSAYTAPSEPVDLQLSKRISYLKESFGASKFIAYFQAFTNTHAPVDRLRTVYDTVLPFKDIVGISIGTRPDCIDRAKIDLIASYKERFDIWLEYGVQSIHERTLEATNRAHSFKDFEAALLLAKGSGISVSAHVILGLPGETREEMMMSAQILSEMGIDGVKIHLLHILKGSPMERAYKDGNIRLLGQDEYVGLACDFLERLSPDIVIQRITGEGKAEEHVAPSWALDKPGTIRKIGEELRRRGSYQGIRITRLSTHPLS